MQSSPDPTEKWNFTPPDVITNAIAWQGEVESQLLKAGYLVEIGTKRIVGISDDFVSKFPLLKTVNFYSHIDSILLNKKEGVPRKACDVFRNLVERGLGDSKNELLLGNKYQESFIFPVVEESPISRDISNEILEGHMYHKQQIAAEYGATPIQVTDNDIVNQERGIDINSRDIEEINSRIDMIFSPYMQKRDNAFGEVLHDLGGGKGWKRNREGKIQLVDYGNENWEHIIETVGDDIIEALKGI